MPEKSTVQARKRQSLATTQRFLPVAEIRGNAILLKNGGLRAVLEVEALNFNLKSETEQQGIIAGYGSFVNSLNFPIQISIRSTRTNIDEYLGKVKESGQKQKSQLLRDQTDSYVRFMQKLIEVADIMEKRFYVVIPLDHSARKKTMIENFLDWMHLDDSVGKAMTRNREFPALQKQLNERCELVLSGLQNIGLHAKRMNTKECIELLYKVYNPKTSQTEKIPDDISTLHTEKTTL
jgi:hypothetical protein